MISAGRSTTALFLLHFTRNRIRVSGAPNLTQNCSETSGGVDFFIVKPLLKPQDMLAVGN